jgi:threonyl-tRNA synthetase
MYFVTGLEKEPKYALRPMGCPGMIQIYKNLTRSWRELPIRYNEFDTIFRKELSGTLHGLFRLQQFNQDDAHIFVREDQIEEEVVRIINSIEEVYKNFTLPYKVVLSTRPSGFMGKIEIWNKAEEDLKKALKNSKIQYEINEGEGAFYGPKIDFHIEDVLGRSWQCGTIQLDFFMPEKFELEYINRDGKAKRPVIIHRTILGSLERFIGILLEHTNGALPFWLSPIQIMVLPIASRHLAYAKEIGERIKDKGFRVEIDERNETLEKKIRNAEILKIPYVLVVGDREVKAKKVALRSREKGDEGQVELEDLFNKILKL